MPFYIFLYILNLELSIYGVFGMCSGVDIKAFKTGMSSVFLFIYFILILKIKCIKYPKLLSSVATHSSRCIGVAVFPSRM